MSQEAKSFTLESLKVLAKQLAVRKQASKEAAQAQARARGIEIGSLEWPIDNSQYWTPFEIRLVYERQVCESCELDTMTFAQELVGFQSTKVAGARRWLRGRGEALEATLPTSCEIIERKIPQCWQCHTLEKHLDTLWDILNRQGVPHA